jgi:hypothetical protein
MKYPISKECVCRAITLKWTATCTRRRYYQVITYHHLESVHQLDNLHDLPKSVSSFYTTITSLTRLFTTVKHTRNVPMEVGAAQRLIRESQADKSLEVAQNTAASGEHFNFGSNQQQQQQHPT